MIRMFILIATLVLSQSVFAQTAPSGPQFEVADVKASKYTGQDAGKARISGGRLDLPYVTLKNLITNAYDVQEDMITGGPAWLDSDHFDIVAKAAADTPPATLRLMLQPFLAERFHLVIHREDKPMPVYAMVTGKAGPKLQPATGGPQRCTWNNPGSGMIQRECHNMTMEELASAMPKWGMAGKVDLPVVDLTGIKGAYDFRLEWSVPRAEAADTSDLSSSTIFDAMAQIGLKLERRKRPVSVIVIDRVERVPTGN
jgi:uncharacterized protein (TIGR03435 family)